MKEQINLFVFLNGYFLVKAFQKLFLKKGLIQKLIGIIGIILLIELFKIINKNIIFTLFLFYEILIFFISVYVLSQSKKIKRAPQKKEQYQKQAHAGEQNSFTKDKVTFDYLNEKEAKKEYRRLMKLYHPDNPNGNSELSKEISEAYQKYCTRMKR